MIVYKISPETASLIQGKEYADGIGFNAVEDVEGNFILTTEQLEKWDKNNHFPIEYDLIPIEYKPKPSELFQTHNI